MSPRPYNLGRRQDQITQGRRQVLDAARALLGDTSGYAAFTVDAVARRADVARATVYYQFASKTGLLEAICDDLAEEGGLGQLAVAFTTDDPTEALRRFVAVFGQFWAVDRPAMRRLRALAALDPDFHQVIAQRDQRRRNVLTVLVERLRSDLDPDRRKRAVDFLTTLTSFETFDSLAGPEAPLEPIAAEIAALALAAVGLAAGPIDGRDGRAAPGQE